VLRAVIGVGAIVYGFSLVGSPQATPGAWLTGIAAAMTGTCLLAGFLTPIASGVLALGALASALSWLPPLPVSLLDTKWIVALVLAVAAAVVPLGPGALSLDARLFGRREIIIPRSPRPRID
jgi:uncharacterized membrane protein YphA (DoxX/SURF4 family)